MNESESNPGKSSSAKESSGAATVGIERGGTMAVISMSGDEAVARKEDCRTFTIVNELAIDSIQKEELLSTSEYMTEICRHTLTIVDQNRVLWNRVAFR